MDGGSDGGMEGWMEGWIDGYTYYCLIEYICTLLYAIFDCLFKACLISYYYIFQLHAYMRTCMHIVTRLLTIRSSTL